MRANIGMLVDGLRRVCRNLRPPTIDSLGLGAALQSYSQEWSDRTGIQVVLQLDKPIGRLPESLELSIFRIVQEGLNNIWKHADASRADIILQHTSPRTLLLIIADDGVGLPETFVPSELSCEGHYGLLGISERVTLMGGRLKFINQEASGLQIEIEIPHPKIS